MGWLNTIDNAHHLHSYEYHLIVILQIGIDYYSRRQNKVERLHNDFTREFNGKVVDKFTC